MVHFFGILSPDFGERSNAVTIPGKVAFFGRAPELALGSLAENHSRQYTRAGASLADDEHYPQAHFARSHPPRFC